ncbi:MAG: transketolase subunit A [Parcubacteria group bacterium Licking1014_1]|nr:MAG: transketolase subunit A [Parcubacteria group bacterium Licking1014_1]
MKINYEKTAREIRKNVLEMKFASQSSHIGSAFSCIDILTVLYFKILNINPKNPTSENRDRFILSKGHAASALYATLARRGFFSENVLKNYCQNGKKLAGHTTKDSVPGIETSTGSLGHGLPMGIGLALAGRKKYKVFVLMSDGECDEGSNWEAALFASHHKLDNLIAIIDYNKLQAFGKTNEVLNLEPLKEKFIAFGWGVKEINGHNHTEIEKALLSCNDNKPNIIIANTIKGKGVSFMENKLKWHYKSLNENEYKKALEELN